MTFLQSYNPTVMRKEDLRAIFVARKKLLQYALKRIKESGVGKSKKHLLLVGSRGSGKTHLQLLIYYAIKDSLSKQWLALKFPEEEYSITSLADLLLCILQEMGQEGVTEAEELRKNLYSSDEADIEEQAIRFIKEYHSQSGKNLLLLLENFQDLAAQLDSKGMHSLRAFIQENDFLMLFPSALSVFRQVADYGEPFYGFFETLHLKEICLADTKKLLVKLAEQEKQNELVKKIDQEGERIKGIYNLTGGNVRLNVLVYHVISHEALWEVETALYNLLDELTPYYQYQMNILSVQQRKILNSMALYEEGAVQPKQLAKLTRIDARVISNQLKQLKELGYVKSRQSGRIARYEMTERLFRIWRETRMQKGKDSRINFLLELFKYFYTPLELLEKHKFWKSKYQTALEGKCEEAELRNAQRICEYLSHLVERREFKDQLATGIAREIKQLLEQGEFDNLLLLVEKVLADEDKVSELWFLKGVALAGLTRYEEALTVVEQGLQLEPSAGAWLCKGLLLTELAYHKEALAAFIKAGKLLKWPETSGLFLLSSSLFLLSSIAAMTENLGLAHQSFSHALECSTKLPEEKQKENFVDYFRQLFEKPKPDFIQRTLNETLSTFPKMQPLLKPFSRALQYLQKPDEEQLKSLHPEEQAIVRDILGLGEDEAKR